MFKKNTFKLFAALSVLLLILAIALALAPQATYAQAAATATKTATVTACPYVTGYVRVGSTSGAGLAGVVVTGVSVTDSTVGAGTTDSSGLFGLGGCGRTGMILTPVLSGYTFSPATATYTGTGQIIFVATATGVVNTPTRTPTLGTPTPTITPTSLTGSYPDLVIYSVVSSPPGWTGGCATTLTSGIRVTVMNSGTVDAGMFVVDVSGTQQTVSSLAAGAMLNLWFVRTGNLVITVDITNMVVESNESNNTRSYVTITGTPPVLCTVTPTATYGTQPPPTITRTPTIGATPSRTATAVITLTRTLTPSTVCSPAIGPLTAPYTVDGANNLCLQFSSISTSVNSWNLTKLTVNGVDFTNLYVPVGSLPAKINGYWYITYLSTVAWGHFEAY